MEYIMDILDKIEPHSSWIKLKEKDYINNSVTETTGAILMESYSAGKLYGKANTVTIYDYGHDEDFISELEESYDELQLDIDSQNEYGIFPLYWERFGSNNMLSVIKLIASPAVCVVDLFFGYNQDMYGFHTYIPGEEKQLKLSDLYNNYPNIRHIIDEINKLKN